MSELIAGVSGMSTCQIKEELDGMINFAKKNNVKSYLEIGARYGDCFYTVMRSLPVGSLGVCVDLPNSLWGSTHSKDHLLNTCERLRREGYKIECILGNSTSPDVIAKVFEVSGSYDLVLIDGDHTYKGVKADFENYSKAARFVAFHDIVGEGQKHHSGACVEVPRLWKELKQTKKSCAEFVAKGSKMGIGVCNV